MAALYNSCHLGSGIAASLLGMQGKREGIPRMLRLSENHSSTFVQISALASTGTASKRAFLNNPL
jgi:hypothetical protein